MRDNPNVLFLIPTLDGGGAEKVLVNLCNALKGEGWGISVRTLFPGGVNTKKLNPAVDVTSMFTRRIPGLHSLMKTFSPEFLYRWLVPSGYDLVVSYLEGVMMRIASGAPEGQRTVAWFHACMYETYIHTYFRSLAEFGDACGRFDLLVAVSGDVRDTVVSKLQAKSPFNCVVLHNVNDTDSILSASREPMPKREDGRLSAVVIGKLTKDKGIWRLLKAYKDSGGVLPAKLKTFFLGAGPEEEEFITKIEDAGFSGSLCLLGYQENPYKWIAAADLLVCPSYREGFSTAVTEALLLGTPVLATDCGGMRELLGDSRYGLVVDNDDSALLGGLLRITGDREMLASYADAAQRRGRAFTKESVLTETMDALRVAAEGGKP